MKHVFFILFFVAVNGYAVGSRKAYPINGAVTTIPTAASTSDAASLIVSNTASVLQACVFNGTASRINVNVEDGSSTSAPTEADAVIAPSTGRCFDGYHIGAAIYQWSATGSTITSGVVDWDVQKRF